MFCVLSFKIYIYQNEIESKYSFVLFNCTIVYMDACSDCLITLTDDGWELNAN